MAIEAQNKLKVHPLYAAMQHYWSLGRDSYQGEAAIKAARTIYLRPTASMYEDGFGSGKVDTPGYKAYESFLHRAYYPDVYEETVNSAVGVMHREPPVIELPPRLESLFEEATDEGEDIYLVLRRINSEQLKTGRLGLLGGLREVDGKPKPYLILHQEDKCFNWDDNTQNGDSDSLRLIMLDESNYEMDLDFSWEWKNKTRVLALVNSEGLLASEGEPATYASAMVGDNDSLEAIQFETLSFMGNESKSIPFTFINSKDLSSVPDKPPLDSLARLALAIYRSEADYRQNLSMQGQDTLVLIGSSYDQDDSVRVGVGARIDVPAAGDAKYIGVDGTGLSEQRESLKSDYEKAEKKSSKLVNNNGGAESGEALKTRVAAQTATLPDIALAGAAGLEKVLRALAVWLNEDPDKVVVKPNLEFSDSEGNAQTLTQLVSSKIAGAKISDESIHEWMVEQGFTKKTYEEELAAIAKEEPLI